MRFLLFLSLLISNIALSQVNLNQGLVAYYPFSGNANDASGNNNNPVFNNATLTTDRFGNANSAYQFNGIDNYMRIPNAPSLNPTNQISICAWVKVTGYYQSICHGNNIVMKGDADYLTGNYMMRFDDGAFTSGQNCSNPTPDITHQTFFGIQTAQTLPLHFIQTGNWYSVVYTSDGVTANLYVNCELSASGPASSLTFTNSYDLFLGKMNNPQYPYWFNGGMDEIRIYNRPLNINEIKYYGNCISAVTGGNIDGIINNYTPVIALNPCNNKITVEDASSFNVGDTVVMMQMKGAVIDSSNTVTFGTITDYKNAGNYEFNYVKSKTGNTVELRNKLQKQYDIPLGKVQLIRVPYYQSVNITSILSCLPWDGSKGGVLILNARDTINLISNVDVSGKGFRGGNDPVTNPPTFLCYENEFFYPVNPDLASEKGEGIALISSSKSYGKGALASGGGGGNSHNSGGAGGGNSGAGGFGGYNFEGAPCNTTVPFDNRGIGGKSLTYSNALGKIFMGGGGGAGHTNNPEGFQAKGGNGSGIVIIIADKLIANNNKIIATGADGLPCVGSGTGCHEGMGGGGGGGAVLADVNVYLDNITIEAKGGKGADMTNSGNLKVGPGGGGGGGMVWLDIPSLPANVTITNTGGLNGVCTGYSNNPWGATAGTDGTSLFNLQISFTNTLFHANIDSVRIKDDLTGCASFDFKGFGYTNTSPVADWQWYFGDATTANTQNASHTYLTNGTYTVKLVVTDINGCKDSITTSVTAGNVLNFDFGYQQNICNPLSVQFTGVGSDNQNPFWSFGDATTLTGTLNPIHLYATSGSYLVKYSVSNGFCTDTISKTINLSVLDDDIILIHDTTICFGKTKQLLTTPALGFCWNPTSFLNDPNSPNPITSTPQDITYYYLAHITGSNLIVNGNFSSGNTGFTSQYNYANPNITEGQYFVGPSPQAWNASLSNCTDHTGANGNMMLINGAPTPDIKVWSQAVSVIPNTNYAFSTWIQALWPPNPAQLQFSINGHDIGNLITASLPTCTWTQFYTTWNSGNNTTASISIVNKNTQVIGNDFALDDISFAPVIIKRDSVKITVEKPVVTATNSTSICEGTQIQLDANGAKDYSWSPATDLTDPTIPNPIATPKVNTQYIVTGTTLNGCTAKDTVDIAINPKPLITRSNDDTICFNNSAQLLAGGGAFYSWTPGSTLSNPSAPNPVATPLSTTTYFVTVTGVNTCKNIDSIKIFVRSATSFSINSPSPICNNTSTQLTASGGDIYSWTPAGSLNDPAIADPIATPNTTTPYTVIINDTLCHYTATLSATVVVLPQPNIKANKTNDIDCAVPQSHLFAAGGLQYNWTPATSLNAPTSATTTATPLATTRYFLTGKDAAGCTNIDSITVNVTKDNFTGYAMPTAFTPNNDGLNDCYSIKYWGNILELEFSIYNRWGERIFFTRNPADCWDGRYKGVPQDPAVFVYMIKARTTCEGSIFRKGTFALIR